MNKSEENKTLHATSRRMAYWVGLTIACTSSERPSEASAPLSEKFATTTATTAQKSGDAHSTAAAREERIPKQLPGTSDRMVMCRNYELLLTRYAFEDLQDNIYCDECEPFDEDACSLDWPSSDVLRCSEYDRMRNGIYAAYGHTFGKQKWQKLFATKPWYKATGKVNTRALPEVAQDNIKFLVDAAAKCRTESPGYDVIE